MNESNVPQIVTVNGYELAATAAAAQAKAEIETAFLVALKKPRNIDNVRAAILAACRRPVFAATAEYAKPVGTSSVRGPSVRFAELALQVAGNIRTSSTVVFENEQLRKVHVSVVDLETNITYGKDISISKTVERRSVKQGQTVLSSRINSSGQTVYLVEATEDELANKQAAAESKIIRNCGLRLIPQDIIEEAMQAARETRKKNAGDPVAAKNAVVDAFAGLGIRPSDLEKYLGKPIAQVMPDDVDNLRAVYTSIRDGETKWSDWQPEEEKPAAGSSEEKAPSKTASLKEKLKAAKSEKEKPAAPTGDDFAQFFPAILARARGTLNLSTPVEQLTEEEKARLLEECRRLSAENVKI